MKGSFILTGADTDSIAICKRDMSFICENDRIKILDGINALYPELIRFEDDGYYDSVLIVKAKNYALKTGDKVKIKGSALKATLKENSLKDFLSETIHCLLDGFTEDVERLYSKKVREIKYLEDISEWCSKKTITDKVLNPKRTNEQRVLDALTGEHIQEGDKVRMFFETEKTLCLEKNFKGVYDDDKLYEKLYKTVKVLAPVLDMEQFPNYKLKRNKEALGLLL